MCAAIECPSKKRLEAFEAGRLSDPELEEIAEHLGSCKACEEIVLHCESSVEFYLRQDCGLEEVLSNPYFQECERRAIAVAQSTIGLDQGDTLVRVLPETPDRIGRFSIDGEIGRGGFGIVYKAHDGQLNRPVAIKVPFQKRGQDGQAYSGESSLVREARAAAALRHPSIVTIYDVGLEGEEQPYVAMEYVEGTTLQQRMLAADLTDCLAWLRQVAVAVAAAHEKEVVHRDLKPANVIVNDKGVVRVMDFGLAGPMVEDGRPVIAGTPAYMSPEQARGFDVTGATDVWSLGVVLYQCLARRLPFSGSDVAQTLEEVRYSTPEKSQTETMRWPTEPPSCATNV